jgi:hypothetical protein
MLEKSKNQIDVYISRDFQPIKGDFIQIVPLEDSWNDFGYRIHCAMHIRIGGQVHTSERLMFAGFLSNNERSSKETESDAVELEEWLFITNDSQILKISSEHSFFTMLRNMDEYRNFMVIFGLEKCQKILKSMNDLVALKEISNQRQYVKKFISTRVFRIGFMRNSESFFAYHNADTILQGVDQEDLRTISTQLSLKFKLKTFTNDHEIDFKYSYDSVIPQRINVLIGKNGLGKSMCLNTFCRAALQYETDRHKLYDPNSKRIMINRLLALGTPGETANTFPIERKTTQKLYYRRLNLTRNSSHGISNRITDMLVQLARSEGRIGPHTRWDLFLESLSKSIDVNKIAIKLTNDTWVELGKFRVYTSELARLEFLASIEQSTEPQFYVDGTNYPLSSGHLTFLKFSILCSLHIENGSFVLMDEPETHLHPNLISDFVDMLDYLLEKTGSFALIATHSVFFVREVNREQVHVFKEGPDGAISIVNPRLRTFGADIDSIAEFVFGQEIESRLVSKILNKVSNKTFEEVEETLGDDISLSALMAIRNQLDGPKQ